MFALFINGLLLALVISKSASQPLLQHHGAGDREMLERLNLLMWNTYPNLPLVDWNGSPAEGIPNQNWKNELMETAWKPSQDEAGQEATERLAATEGANVEKRDKNYMSMCHFKICNLGRKRRFPQQLLATSGSL